MSALSIWALPPRAGAKSAFAQPELPGCWGHHVGEVPLGRLPSRPRERPAADALPQRWPGRAGTGPRAGTAPELETRCRVPSELVSRQNRGLERGFGGGVLLVPVHPHPQSRLFPATRPALRGPASLAGACCRGHADCLWDLPCALGTPGCSPSPCFAAAPDPRETWPLWKPACFHSTVAPSPHRPGRGGVCLGSALASLGAIPGGGPTDSAQP